MKIELEGSPEGGEHPAHFHDGTDCSQNEPVVHDLGPVENMMSEKVVEESFEDLVEANYYLNVHLSADEIATVVACGDEYEVMDEMVNGGAGGMAPNNGTPVIGLGLVTAVLAAGTLLAIQGRSI